MLLFLNIDCVLDVPSDAAGPSGDGAGGVRRLEAVLRAWPQWRVVITSERRYRMTLDHFRAFFSPRMQSRLVATTPLYDRRSGSGRRLREDEIDDYLVHEAPVDVEWIALDARAGEYPRTDDRLVCCESFTAQAAGQLQRALLRRTRSRGVRAEACPPPLCATLCITG